jgi:hypothetical protein
VLGCVRCVSVSVSVYVFVCVCVRAVEVLAMSVVVWSVCERVIVRKRERESSVV